MGEGVVVVMVKGVEKNVTLGANGSGVTRRK